MEVRLGAMQLAILFMAAGFAQAAENNGVAKVIELLRNLQTKSQRDMNEEEIGFNKFMQWSSDTIDDRNKRIADYKEQTEQLQANIDADLGAISELSDSITEKVKVVTSADQDKAQRIKQRESDKVEYDAEYKDLSESCDALARALVVIKRHLADVKQVGSLAQVSKAIKDVRSLSLLTPEASSMLTTFMDQEENDDKPEFKFQDKANAYEFQSHGIIAMLEKLQKEFEDQRNKVAKAEMNAKHSHAMMVQELSDRIRYSSNEKDRLIGEKASKEKSVGENKAALGNAQDMLSQNEKYLRDTMSLRDQKSKEYPVRRELRENEQKALTKALDIMVDMQGQLGLIQHSKVSLMQVQNVRHKQSGTPAKAMQYLLRIAHQLHSDNLSQLTERVNDGPFEKVKKMIYDMINKLKDQANDEASHKGWCDAEMQTNEQQRGDKEREMDKLTARRDTLNGDISQWTEDVATLNQEIAKTEKARAEAENTRREEKQENTVAIRDASDAQFACGRAIGVLQEFYSKAKGATALLTMAQQQDDPSEDAPETWDSVNAGFQDSNHGVVAILEVIQKDFAQTEAEIQASEAENQAIYDRFMMDSERDVKVAKRNVENKTRNLASAKKDLVQTEENLKNTEQELWAANKYHQKLIPACVHKPQTYEERVAKREAEISALKEALRILSDNSTE
jgi:peptidoglycan hydrolase CwlO-like protein